MKRLGLDIGHCNFAGAYFELNKSRPSKIEVASGQATIPAQFMLTNEQLMKLRAWEENALEQIQEFKKQGIDTEIYPDYDFLNSLGNIVIGNDVPTVVEYGREFQYFKTIPENFNEFFGESPFDQKKLNLRYGTLMACFCHALIKNYIKYGQVFDESDGENLKLIVGCPSAKKWTSCKARKKYAKLIKNATGVAQVEIIPESRGALFGVSNEKKGISVADGVIIFDFGSLTADCTYMITGVRMAEFSWELGASCIEKEMTNLAIEYIENECEKNGDVARISDSNRIKAYRELRVEKEKYFKGQLTTKGGKYFFDYNSNDGETEEKIIIDDTFMDKVIYDRNITIDCGNYVEKTGSWTSLCKEFFETAKNKIINIEKLPVKTIVLTGGASQMDFIANICEEVFGIKPLMDENVEFAVANGLAWVSLSEEKYPEIFEKAKGEIRISNKDRIQSLNDSIKEKICKFVKDKMREVSDEWLKDNKYTTMVQLRDLLIEKFSGVSLNGDYKKVIEPLINKWKTAIDDGSEKSIDDLVIEKVNAYIEKLYAPEIKNNIVIKEIDLGDINIQLGEMDFSTIINKIDIDSFRKKCWNGAKRILAGAGEMLGFDFYDDVDKDIQKEKDAQKTKVLIAEEKQKVYSKINGYTIGEKIKIEVETLVDKIDFNDICFQFLDSKVEKAFKVAMLMDFEKTGWSDDDE